MPLSQEEPETVPLWKRLVVGRNPKRTIVRALVLAFTALIIFSFVLLPIRIKGISMAPRCRDGQLDVVYRLAYRWSKPKRSDVVSIRSPLGIHDIYCKRIIGLPGETVAIKRGTVLIDGEPLDEPYIQDRQPWEIPALKLEADEYYLIGDNRTMPQEQHVFGRAYRSQIVGKVLW